MKVVVQEQGFEKDLVCQKDLLGFVDPGLLVGPFGDPDCGQNTHSLPRVLTSGSTTMLKSAHIFSMQS